MDKRELIQRLQQLTDETPRAAKDVYWACIELERWSSRIDSLETIDTAEAHKILAAITELQRRIVAALK